MTIEEYKQEIIRELERLYPNHKENQQLMKESEQFLSLYLDDNLTPTEAVSAIVSGL